MLIFNQLDWNKVFSVSHWTLLMMSTLFVNFWAAEWTQPAYTSLLIPVWRSNGSSANLHNVRIYTFRESDGRRRAHIPVSHSVISSSIRSSWNYRRVGTYLGIFHLKREKNEIKKIKTHLEVSSPKDRIARKAWFATIKICNGFISTKQLHKISKSEISV